MGFAEAADCPVILIADIDRGGVFAHLLGTLDLLSESEQNRVIGFIINRFRGDIDLLSPGLDWLESRSGKPVLGVIPYLEDFFLDAEDAITSMQVLEKSRKSLKVVVPVLPRISNHTDFDALRLHPNVDLEFVSVKHPCPSADLIILPGSKNVLEDLNTLRQAGWADIINRHLRYGGKVLGICGGYQMLGQSLTDPHAVESEQISAVGFGFLAIDTELQPEKKLSQVKGHFSMQSMQCIRPDENEDAIAVLGYEIHCGITEINEANYTSLFELENDERDGLINHDKNIMGTYLHGLFDHPEACGLLLSWAGLPDGDAIDLASIREQQLDRLANCLQSNLSEAFLHQLLDGKEVDDLIRNSDLRGIANK